MRTTFFVNTAAIAAATALLMWTGYRELQISNLGAQVADAQAQIDSKAKQHADALRLSKSFADEEKKIQEALTFGVSVLSPSDFIIHLGRTLPKNIAIEFVDMRFNQSGGPAIILRGIAAGPSEQATGIASTYVDVFRTEPAFTASIANAEITTVNRDVARGVVTFEIVLRLKEPGKEAKS